MERAHHVNPAEKVAKSEDNEDSRMFRAMEGDVFDRLHELYQEEQVDSESRTENEGDGNGEGEEELIIGKLIESCRNFESADDEVRISVKNNRNEGKVRSCSPQGIGDGEINSWTFSRKLLGLKRYASTFSQD